MVRGIRALGLLALGVSLLVPTVAYAEPILLTSFQRSLSPLMIGGPGLSDLSGPSEVAYNLSFDFPPDCSNDAANLTGCALRVPAETSGTFDFTSANTLNFSSVSQRLTDGINDPFTVSLTLYDAGQPRFGVGWGTDELSVFGALLESRTITLIRLLVDQGAIETHPDDVVSIATNFKWEFWGEGEPLPPAPVPEPGTLSLLIGGAFALVVRQRRGARVNCLRMGFRNN
jgi:hypothetical protein